MASAIDTGLFVGACPFRGLPSTPDDISALRRAAALDRAIATGFGSLFYHDPEDGLARDLERFDQVSDWLRFYAVVNPEFPRLETQVRAAAEDARIAGIRLLPTLHHFDLDSDRVRTVLRLARECGLPVNVTARLLDGRVAPRYLHQGTLSTAQLASFLAGAGEATVVLSMFFFNELQALQVEWGDLPSVVLDLGCSKPTTASFDQLGSWFPLDRVVFGTGAPLYYWTGSRLALEGALLPEEAKAAILADTAKGVFRWA